MGSRGLRAAAEPKGGEAEYGERRERVRFCFWRLLGLGLVIEGLL